MTERLKIQTLINTKNEYNINLAIELARSIDKHEWIQKDYLDLCDKLITYIYTNPLLAERIIKEWDDTHKIKFMFDLKNLTIFDYPPNYFDKRYSEVLALKTLQIKSTHIEKIPDFVFEMPTITKLILQRMNLKTLPKIITKMKQLQSLNLNNNNLENLPPSFKQLQNLKNLFLISNQFSKIPEVLFSMKNLNANIYLTGNNLDENHVNDLRNHLPNCFITSVQDDLPF